MGGSGVFDVKALTSAVSRGAKIKVAGAGTVLAAGEGE